MKIIGNLIYRLQRLDWILALIVFILISIGMAAVYSVDSAQGRELIYVPTQMVALGIGLILFFILSSVHMTFFEASSKIGYIVSLVLLILVLIFGESIRGTVGWFRFGDFSFQPAEVAKASLIIYLAYMVSKQGRRFDTFLYIVRGAVPTFILIGLIMLQPDFGSALVLGSIWFGMLLFSGAKKRYLIILVLFVVLVFVLGWFFFFEEYQKDRLRTFVNIEADAYGAGYNVRQSIIAIGSGQLYGRGIGFGSQSQLHFLPEAQTDFIFAVVAEELGFLGSVTVLVLYGLLLWRLIIIAKMSPDDFSAFTVVGIATFFFTQIVFNVGAASGILPVTGLTLPFLSYGGSSLIVNLVLMGVAESIAGSAKRHESSLTFLG
jgi:rod shape determining protein RodA